MSEHQNIECKCPNCGYVPTTDRPRCDMYVAQSNETSASVRIFCEKCKKYTDMTSESGVVTKGETYNCTFLRSTWDNFWPEWRFTRIAERTYIVADLFNTKH